MSITPLENSSAQAGDIRNHPGIAVASMRDSLGQQLVVTAVATSGDNLRLISWKLSPKGAITRFGDSNGQAGPVRRLAMVLTPSGFLVTGVRTAEGNLLLIAWRLNFTNGEITRVSDTHNITAETIPIQSISMGTFGDKILVAMRDAAGNLLLESWVLNSEDRLLYGRAKVSGGAIRDVTVGAVAKKYAFTAVMTAGGNLKIIIWQVSADGTLKRKGDSGEQGGPITRLDTVRLQDDWIITVVRDPERSLQLISWQVSADGMTVTRLGDSGQALPGTELLASAFFNDGGDVLHGKAIAGRVYTAVRTASKLRIMGWQVEMSGAIKHLADKAEQPVRVEVIAFDNIDSAMFLTAVRDVSTSRLRLDTWHIDTL